MKPNVPKTKPSVRPGKVHVGAWVDGALFRKIEKASKNYPSRSAMIEFFLSKGVLHHQKKK